MIGFSLIGTPAGYESLHFGLNKSIDIDSYVDLNNRAINIFPNSEIFRISRFSSNNNTYLLFICYNYALEINNTRDGTYYGSVLAFENCYIDVKFIVKALRDLSKSLRDICIDNTNNRYTSTIRSISKANTPESVKQLESQTYHILQNTNESTNNNQIFMIVDHHENLINDISNIIKNDIFLDYNNTYISDNIQVIKYVLEKKILPISTFQELFQKKLANIKILKIENVNQKNTIEQLGKEIANLQLEIKQLQNPISNTEKNIYTRQIILEQQQSSNINSFPTKYKKNNKFLFIKKEIAKPIGILILFTLIIILFYIVSIFSDKSNEDYNIYAGTNSNKNYTYTNRYNILDSLNKSSIDTSKNTLNLKDSCAWDNKEYTYWIYKSSEIKDVDFLVEYIAKIFNRQYCNDWINSLKRFIIDNNKRDIANEYIATSGTILIALPSQFVLRDTMFKKKYNKLSNNNIYNKK